MGQAGKFPTLVQHSDNLETKVTEVRSQVFSSEDNSSQRSIANSVQLYRLASVWKQGATC